jgi:hypothetical protein
LDILSRFGNLKTLEIHLGELSAAEEHSIHSTSLENVEALSLKYNWQTGDDLTITHADPALCVGDFPRLTRRLSLFDVHLPQYSQVFINS